MKWMLIVAVFGAQPVKTEMLFDSLDTCLKAEEAMRAEMAEAYRKWDAWAAEDGATRWVNGRDAARAYNQKRILNSGTCIPHAAK